MNAAQLEKSLHQFLGYRVNWDGEGARPISLKAIETARSLYFLFEDGLPVRDRELVKGFGCSALPYGGVAFSWSSHGFELELLIQPEGAIDTFYGYHLGTKQEGWRAKEGLNQLEVLKLFLQAVQDHIDCERWE